MKAFLILAWREWIRFTREPARVFATIATPTLLWLFTLGGFGSLSGLDSRDHIAGFTAVGAALAVCLFSTVFASIGFIQDREDGYLQAVLSSPAPRWTIAASRMFVGGTLAGTQGSVVLIAGAIATGDIDLLSVLASCALLVWIGIGTVALGLAFASRISSSSGFHSVMSLVLLPMWALSGALFPPDGATHWMENLMRWNPMRWSHACLNDLLGTGSFASPTMWAGALATPIILGIAACTAISRRPRGAQLSSKHISPTCPLEVTQ